MISDHPWLGVGAGNFGRHFPQYAAATVAEDAAEPHNFLLELWASYGVFALAAVLVSLGAFFYLVVTRRPPEDESPPPHSDEAGARDEARREGEAPAEPHADGSAGASPSPETPSPVRPT